MLLLIDCGCGYRNYFIRSTVVRGVCGKPAHPNAARTRCFHGENDIVFKWRTGRAFFTNQSLGQDRRWSQLDLRPSDSVFFAIPKRAPRHPFPSSGSHVVRMRNVYGGGAPSVPNAYSSTFVVLTICSVELTKFQLPDASMTK